jgi:hypothetical protein
MRDGFLTVEGALSPDEVQIYLDAIDRVVEVRGDFDGKKGYGPHHIVSLDPAFTELIDHPRHVGFGYDIYGEQTKLHGSNFLLRPRDSNVNIWHHDGPRALPYDVFSPVLPMQLKVAYWLTDLPHPEMGNFVYAPGSHRLQYLDTYDTHESVAGEVITTPTAGTMTFMHNALWHRVDENHSDIIRRNIFITYSPAWITNGDRHHSDAEWLKSLNREQQILMREYRTPYENAKPPGDHFPLFLDRDTKTDRDDGKYRDHVELHRRKRETWVEKAGRKERVS